MCCRCLLISLNLMIVHGPELYYGKVEGYNRTCMYPKAKKNTRAESGVRTHAVSDYQNTLSHDVSAKSF